MPIAESNMGEIAEAMMRLPCIDDEARFVEVLCVQAWIEYLLNDFPVASFPGKSVSRRCCGDTRAVGLPAWEGSPNVVMRK